MLQLGRSVGEKIQVETPDGQIRLTVVDVPAFHKVTVKVEHDSVTKERSLRDGKPIVVRQPSGTLTVELSRIEAKGRWGRVNLGLDSPRDWTIWRIRAKDEWPPPGERPKAGAGAQRT